MTVSRPKVLYREENGQKLEPIEEVIIDVDEEYASSVIDAMNRRKAEMTDMRSSGVGKSRITFLAPSRGLDWLSEQISDQYARDRDYEPFVSFLCTA